MAKRKSSTVYKYSLWLTLLVLIFFIGSIFIAAYEIKNKQIINSNAAAGACNSSAYDTTVLADNPIAYWQLGDTMTTVSDCSAAALHPGTYRNAPKTTTLPNGDPVKVFNGSTQYAEIPDANDLSVIKTGIITLEAWMRPDTLQFPNLEGSGYVHWMGKKANGGNCEYVARMYALTNAENRPNRISGYSFNLTCGLGAGSYFEELVSKGEWIHYALVINTKDTSPKYPTGYTKVYKNGSLRDTDSLKGYAIIPGNGTAPLRLGTANLDSYFQGAIGKVAFYNYEVSADKLYNHYKMMSSTSETPQHTNAKSIKPTITNIVPSFVCAGSQIGICTTPGINSIQSQTKPTLSPSINNKLAPTPDSPPPASDPPGLAAKFYQYVQSLFGQ